MHAFMDDAVQAFLPEGMEEFMKILRLKDEQVAFCPDADSSARIQPKQLCRAQRHRIQQLLCRCALIEIEQRCQRHQIIELPEGMIERCGQDEIRRELLPAQTGIVHRTEMVIAPQHQTIKRRRGKRVQPTVVMPLR